MGQGAAEGLPVGVLAPLQDELLALEVMVLETHPAVKGARAARESNCGKTWRHQAAATQRRQRGEVGAAWGPVVVTFYVRKLMSSGIKDNGD